MYRLLFVRDLYYGLIKRWRFYIIDYPSSNRGVQVQTPADTKSNLP
jgi:hypothetical protein